MSSKKVIIMLMCLNILTGCGASTSESLESMETVTETSFLDEKTEPTQPTNVELDIQKINKSSMEMLSLNVSKDKNIIISPISVLIALSVITNGANGNTKNEILEVTQENLTLYSNDTLKVSNSIWIDETRITLNQDFVNNSLEFFNAKVETLDFNNSKSVDIINNWISDSTNGAIKDMIKSLEPTTVMHIINAIAFEDDWKTPYYDTDIIENYTFTNSDGTEKTVTMLSSTESTYISTDKLKGFIKPYKSGRYSFVGIVPQSDDEDITKYLDDINLDTLNNLLSSKQDYEEVNVLIPEFEAEFDVSLNDTLKSMGVQTAFTTLADFKNIGETRTSLLYIDNVQHKAKIEVNRKGTKAYAITDITMKDNSCAIAEFEPKYVYLNRPFLYMILDNQNNIPIFVGVQNIF